MRLGFFLHYGAGFFRVKFHVPRSCSSYCVVFVMFFEDDRTNHILLLLFFPRARLPPNQFFLTLSLTDPIFFSLSPGYAETSPRML